ncbi:MAG TPA: AEC family transporter [Bacteriovoracaceae bacterium]|nr:AEC family transporter [Bacteriovoracaceae bacterium]
MTNISVVILCLLIGLLLQRNKSLPKDAHIALNAVILHVPLPAIALLNIPKLEWDLSLMTLVLVPWIIFGIGALIIPLVGKYFSWDRATIGCLILTAGLGNTSFVGFPVLEALYGREALKYGIFLDQAGSFLIISLFGVGVATKYSFGALNMKGIFKKIFLFPPFLAFLLAVIMAFLGWKAEGMVEGILTQLAVTLTPLALVSVGLQLKIKEFSGELRPLLFGLGYKLLLAPLIIFSLYTFLDLPKIIFNVSVIEAAMGPMITGAIIASTYSLNARLTSLMVGVGVPASFLTLYCWHLITK